MLKRVKKKLEIVKIERGIKVFKRVFKRVENVFTRSFFIKLIVVQAAALKGKERCWSGGKKVKE